MNLLNLSNNNKNLLTIRIFRYALYMWFLIYYNTLAFNYNFFWGIDGYIPSLNTMVIFGDSFLNLFSYSLIAKYPLILIFSMNLFLFLAMSNLKNRLYPIIIFFLSLTLDTRAYYILDGGNNLINLLSIYNIFFTLDEDRKNVIGIMSSSMSNLSLLMAKVQVCIVYFVAGHLKLSGELWANGTALYYTLSLSELSTSYVRDVIKTINPILIVLPAYSLLAYQLSFPWLVWFKQTRKYILFLGLIFHLGISFIMGLTFFGYALCVSYFLFYDEAESSKLINIFSILKNRFLSLKPFKNFSIITNQANQERI